MHRTDPVTAPLRIGLVGDHDPSVVAHRAIPRALSFAAEAACLRAEPEWLPTEAIASGLALDPFDGLWAVPATPYRSMDGALLAIRHARESGLPFLGTCGGFQHALVEYARSILGWADADHAETADPAVPAARLVVTPLTCGLVETTGLVRFSDGSRLAAAYGRRESNEGYHCRYGLNPALRTALLGGMLRLSALDDAGDVRAVELDGHPFFVATLFQPERAALDGMAPPIVTEFLRASAASRRSSAST